MRGIKWTPWADSTCGAAWCAAGDGDRGRWGGGTVGAPPHVSDVEGSAMVREYVGGGGRVASRSVVHIVVVVHDGGVAVIVNGAAVPVVGWQLGALLESAWWPMLRLAPLRGFREVRRGLWANGGGGAALASPSGSQPV